MITVRRIAAILALALTLAVGPSAVAQNIDYSSVDVSQVPESTIKQQAEKLKKAGVTLDQALSEAEIRGASKTQLRQLRSRLSRYLTNNKSAAKATPTTSSDAQGMSSDKTLSEKETRVTYTRQDSLLFGFNIFNRDGLSFTPSTSLAVGDSYVVGIGDMINIDIYGGADQTYELNVSSDGAINIPMVGPVKVAGLTMSDARRAIEGKLRSIYSGLGRETGASIRLSQTAPVTVSVIGEAFMPGTFTVSSTSTLFNVLYLSGGPNRNGSFRDIQLIRGGKIVAHLDVYDFLLNGRTAVNVSLADGDIVMIPTYIKRVMTGGEFKRVGYFEAKEGETAADLIRYAGGFTPRAMTSHVGMFRAGKATTEYIDVADPASVLLANGDSIVVGAIDNVRIDNAVSVSGAVFAPGDFEWSEGLKLSALIEKAGGLKENAFLTRGVITRYKEDYTLESLNFNVLDVKNGVSDIELRSGDKVTIASIDDMREFRTVSISGQVQLPGTYTYRDNLTLGDLLILANGPTEMASLKNVEIVRRIEDDTDPNVSRTTHSVSITRDLTIGSGDNSFALEPFDEVFIRSNSNYTSYGSVSLSGAFISPGSYGLTSNSTRLSDILERSGGFTSRADLSGAHIFRRIELSDTERAVKLIQSNAMNDTVFYLRANNTQPYELLAINLNEALSQRGGRNDIFLQDGDQIVVPESSQSVRVSGIVMSPTNIIWNKKWDAKDYIRAAGGFGVRAYKKRTYVVHANGESEGVRHFLWFRIYPDVRPGSEVVVPRKPLSTLGAPSIVSMSASVVSMVAVIVSLTK